MLVIAKLPIVAVAVDLLRVGCWSSSHWHLLLPFWRIFINIVSSLLNSPPYLFLASAV